MPRGAKFVGNWPGTVQTLSVEKFQHLRLEPRKQKIKKTMLAWETYTNSNRFPSKAVVG